MRMSVLIIFASVEGQTQKVARFVADEVKAAGHAVRLVDASDNLAEVSFDDTDTVILAAPVHERRHPANFELILTASRMELAARRTLMLSISLGAAFPELMEEAREYLREMKMRTGFLPDAEALIAGAVRPSSYGYYESQVLRHAVLRDQPNDPATQEQEFTDWGQLADVVADFLQRAA
jgi:menaquinone-dependent protoporphyrinogen oxidase